MFLGYLHEQVVKESTERGRKERKRRKKRRRKKRRKRRRRRETKPICHLMNSERLLLPKGRWEVA